MAIFSFYKSFRDSEYYICARCKRDKKTPGKLSKENKMVLSNVPDALKDLTQVMKIQTKPNGGQQAYKGRCSKSYYWLIYSIMPRNSEDIPVIAFKINGKDNKSQKLKDRWKNAENTLARLTGTDENGGPNNFLYKDVTIDCDLLEKLSVDGYLSEAKSVEFDSNELEFDSDCNDFPDPRPKNSDYNVYSKYTETGRFLPGNLISNKENVVMNNEIFSPQSHGLTLGSERLN